MTIKTEYGLMLDCAKQGCDPKHADDGRVFFESKPGPATINFFENAPKPTINGHAATWVSRTVTYTEWEPVDG